MFLKNLKIFCTFGHLKRSIKRVLNHEHVGFRPIDHCDTQVYGTVPWSDVPHAVSSDSPCCMCACHNGLKQPADSEAGNTRLLQFHDTNYMLQLFISTSYKLVQQHISLYIYALKPNPSKLCVCRAENETSIFLLRSL